MSTQSEPSAEPATITVTADELHSFWVEVLQAADVPEDAAHTLTSIQVAADLRGVHSHGTRAIIRYIGEMESGSMDPAKGLSIVRETPAMAITDGNAGIGQVAAKQAMSLALVKARQSGVGIVGVRRSSHAGALAYYTMQAAAAGMIGFATSGRRVRRANMAAFGSITPLLANHPLSWAIPAGEAPPIVLDMATGVVAFGKIGLAQRDGKPLPPGWALDAAGQPTEDAAKAAMVLPLGAKGSALSLVMSVLGGFLVASGQSRDSDLPDLDTDRPGHFLMAINVEHFVRLSDFQAEIDERIHEIRNGTPAPGHERVYVPGEIEWLLAERRRREGIPMHAGDIGSFNKLAVRLGVSATLG